MRYLLLVLMFSILCSCNEEKQQKRDFSTVEIEHLMQDSLLNVRALEVTAKSVVAASSSGDIYKLLSDDSTFGKYIYENGNSDIDSIGNNNFRAISQLKLSESGNIFEVLGITIGSPTKLYKQGRLVYLENHPKTFYNSMDFWNDQEGIAIGDPTDYCMSIIITRDGGETWNKLSCDDLPKIKDGEAAFAASDTNIAIVGNHTWVATGGKTSRILYSPDKGNTWEVFDTPIIQGKETTGMYSVDFYDELHGFAIGGDYTKPEDNRTNKIRTEDGGKTWKVVADNKEPGYRSCVQYFPNREGKELVVVGFNGIDYSNDAGTTWKHLSDEGFYTIRFLNDSIAYATGKGRISKLTFR